MIRKPLEGVAQEEADFAAGVALLAITLFALPQSVQLWFDLPNTGHLLTLLLAMEIWTGELMSHGLRPAEKTETVQPSWVTLGLERHLAFSFIMSCS